MANLDAYNITGEMKRKNFLIILISCKVFSTLSDLTAPDLSPDKTYGELIDLLKEHYVTKPSYHRSLCLFQRRVKKSEKSLKELYVDLKRLAKDCNFGTTFDARLRDQLLMAIDSQSYFKFLMAENLKLEGLTSVQLLDRIGTLEKAHVGEDAWAKNFPQCDVSAPVIKSNKEIVSCKHCGYLHQSYFFFFKFKHLCCHKVCQGKLSAAPLLSAREFPNSKFKKGSVKVVSHESEDDEGPASFPENYQLLEIDETISVRAVNAELYYFKLKDVKVPLEVDSGAAVSLLTEEWWK